MVMELEAEDEDEGLIAYRTAATRWPKKHTNTCL